MALLALAHGEVVPLSKLIDALWEESDPPTTAAKQVRNTVSEMRGIHPSVAAAVETAFPGYRLRLSQCSLDIDRFCTLADTARTEEESNCQSAIDHYRQAIDMWQGTAVEGAGNTAIEARTRLLDDRRLEVTERWLQLEIDFGTINLGQMTVVCEALTSNPYRENLVTLAMQAFAACGSRERALSLYRATESAMSSELGVAPGAALRRAMEQITSGVYEPVVRTSVPRLRTEVVQRQNGPIVGRDSQLDTAEKQCTDRAGDAHIYAVDGMACVGKSVFAANLARRLATKYADGFCMVDIRSHSPTSAPMTTSEALTALLAQSGVTGVELHASFDVRRELWFQLQTERAVVFVLDDVVDEEQVNALVAKKSSSIAIVTSRTRLTGLDLVRAMTLEPLDVEAGAQLFAVIVGDGRPESDLPATQSIVELCGGIPLVICAAAARVRHRPAWTIRAFADHINQDPSRLLHIGPERKSLAAALTVSVLRQDREHLEMLHSVARESDLAATTASASFGARRERLLEDLVDANLLEHGDPGRYRLHALVRRFLLDTDEPNDSHSSGCLNLPTAI
ncbi:AfsR/SARP family transcriptional regulator [Rhodococcoides fascians]|jgi:DNA-binding SARP family transcriptional activator|uniref:AfsR/SARP family transcriptional regulator n=1 Tax=Rhodococcoides fascians TaxID=1828 RepID=UPI003CF70DF2